VEGGARHKAGVESRERLNSMKLTKNERKSFLAVSIILFSKHLFLFFWMQSLQILDERLISKVCDIILEK